MFKYNIKDLDYIFIRAKLPNGNWGNLSLSELSDKDFVDWAEKKFGIKIIDTDSVINTPWKPQHKVDFLNEMMDRLGQPPVVMIKRDKRKEFNKIGKDQK
jgi:hypothetical protein